MSIRNLRRAGFVAFTTLTLGLASVPLMARPHTHLPPDGSVKDSKGVWHVTGTVTGVNLPAWTITMTDGHQGYPVLIQKVTQFAGPHGKVPGLAALNSGDKVQVDGLMMDDGRLMATRVTFLLDTKPSWEPIGEPASPTEGLFISNLHNGSVVPPIFHLEGEAVSRAYVRVTVRSDHPLMPGRTVADSHTYAVDGRADGRGRFDIVVRADTEPPGSRMLLEILTADEHGNRSGPLLVNVLRQ